jgi:hypothetical protein
MFRPVFDYAAGRQLKMNPDSAVCCSALRTWTHRVSDLSAIKQPAKTAVSSGAGSSLRSSLSLSQLLNSLPLCTLQIHYSTYSSLPLGSMTCEMNQGKTSGSHGSV